METTKQMKGLAVLKLRDPERFRAIQQQGAIEGSAAAKFLGRGHRFTSETGRLAGAKGSQFCRGGGRTRPLPACVEV